MNFRYTFIALLFALLLALLPLANANYLIHLKYSNGAISQEEVYKTDAKVPAKTSGDYAVSVGSYSGNTSFPLITLHDPPVSFDAEGNQTSYPAESEVIVQETSADAFLVVPEVPAASPLKVVNASGATLLSTTLKQAIEIKKPSSTGTNNNAGANSGGTNNAGTRPAGTKPASSSSGGFCGSGFILLGIASFAFFAARKPFYSS